MSSTDCSDVFARRMTCTTCSDFTLISNLAPIYTRCIALINQNRRCVITKSSNIQIDQFPSRLNMRDARRHFHAFSRLSQLLNSHKYSNLPELIRTCLGNEVNSLLETPKQLASRIGISVGAINRLVNDGKLSFVRIGTRRRIPPGAWEDYIETHTVKPWRDAIRDQNSYISKGASPSIFFGQSEAAVASAALAQQTANRLKLLSRNSSNATHKNSAHANRQKS